jgi:hypothetical protein
MLIASNIVTDSIWHWHQYMKVGMDSCRIWLLSSLPFLAAIRRVEVYINHIETQECLNSEIRPSFCSSELFRQVVYAPFVPLLVDCVM